MKIVFAGLSYLFGSIPSGYVLYLLSERKDIRRFGSGATGATNVLRLKGWAFAVPVLLFDLFKGFLPVFLAVKLYPGGWFPLLCGFLAVLGHCFPVYIKFRGGKGVATSLGVFSVLAFQSFLVGLFLFLAVIALTRYVSLGSLVAALSLVPTAYFLHSSPRLTVLAAAVLTVIVIRHLGNIGRLLSGTERKFGQRRT